MPVCQSPGKNMILSNVSRNISAWRLDSSINKLRLLSLLTNANLFLIVFLPPKQYDLHSWQSNERPMSHPDCTQVPRILIAYPKQQRPLHQKSLHEHQQNQCCKRESPCCKIHSSLRSQSSENLQHLWWMPYLQVVLYIFQNEPTHLANDHYLFHIDQLD